ncbi:MAG: OsmC family protein [Candidatus Limnocylindria bacterium]
MPMRVVASVPDPARLRVEAQTESGQPIDMDGDPPDGDDSAAGPREALLAALAGCTAMDVVSILRKKRQRAIAYEIGVEAESADAQPRVFTAISVEHRVSGAVEAEALRRSVELSATRYCPVSAMLSKAVAIQHRYRLEGGESVLVVVTGPDGIQIA